MAEFDNIQKIAPFLDKHLLLPLLEHAQSQNVYDEKQVLQAQLDLLKKTKLVDLVAEKYKALHKTDDMPAELKDLRQNAVLQLKELKADCKQLLTVIEDPSLAKIKTEKPSEGKESTKTSQEKAFKDALLQLIEKQGIEDSHIESLYKYAKLHYECGNYGMVEGSEKMGAGEFLPIYRILCKERTGNADGALSALWGKLASGILLEKWDETLDDLKELRDFIDAKQFRDPLQQLQQRSWFLHWALFVYFKPDHTTSHPTMRADQFREKLFDEVIDLFFAPPYLQTVQTNCPWLLRYIATAVITNPRRRNVLKDLVRVIQQERHTYSDPITEFVECLLLHYDFDSAQERLQQCEKLLVGDYFIMGLKDDFINNARLFIFETYCRIHQCIDIKMLAERLNMKQDEAELWIVNLIRNARLDAKIDSEKHHVIMGSTKPTVYQQVTTKTKALCFRSYVLAGNFQKRTQKPSVDDYGV
jgi:translation initiation factor 3 subunit E